MRIYNIEENVMTLGPGKRACIWLQGCNRSCKGCMSPMAQGEGGWEISVDALVSRVKGIPNIEGITLSGGEVFLQIPELHAFLKRIKEETELGVIIYTGYLLEELRAMGDKKVDEIIDKFTDILIDGPYIDELNDGVSLRGSSNQKVHFLTGRHEKYRDLYNGKVRKIQVNVKGDHAFMVGVPTREVMEKWNFSLAKKGKK